MIRDKRIDRICLAAAGLACVLAALLTVGCILLGQPPAPEKPDRTKYLSTEYADLLFDPGRVHELDIRIPQVNWDYMVLHAEEEVYVLCDVVIDGETAENAAIRPKGNSSLSAIKWMGSERFSFKIEFDHYREENTWHGLDKLALNNMGQDTSCMKDHITYRMMNAAGIPAPLSSYVEVKLNGEPFGLYLAVEAIEDSFAWRNYGAEFGNLYKPDCLAVSALDPKAFGDAALEMDVEALTYDWAGPGDRVDPLSDFIRKPFEVMFGPQLEVSALKYLGDDPRQYELVFGSAVFDLTAEDKASYIRAVKTLNTSARPLDAVDLDSVADYFVVHNFVNNYDGYTGIFVHNFYLREQDGKLSFIPWDYNLGFGIFTLGTAMESFLPRQSPYYAELPLGNAMSDAMSMVNYPIDDPTFSVAVEDRPMLAAVLRDPEGLALYHERCDRFLTGFFDSGDFEALYRTSLEQVRPYVDAGMTFYTPDEFAAGADAVYRYCLLRSESIRGQLDGVIPSTAQGQSGYYDTLVDTGDLFMGDSMTFDGIVLGLESRDVLEILDAVAGDAYPHDSEGVTRALADAAADTGRIPAMIGRVVSQSRFLKKILSALVQPVALFLLSAAALPVAVKTAGRYRRRRSSPKAERRAKDAAAS